MKLLLVFINEEYRPMVPINLTCIESYVKKSGHEVKVFDTSFYEDIMTEGLNKKYKSGSYQCVDYSHVGIKINNNSSSQDLLKLDRRLPARLDWIQCVCLRREKS